MIKATTSAVKQLQRVLGKNNAIFFGARGGGCSGFEYELRPVKEGINGDKIDELVSVSGVPMLLCGRSMFMLIGTEIDWLEDSMGSRFTFSNPNASGTCGCGSTFSMDLRKLNS